MQKNRILYLCFFVFCSFVEAIFSTETVKLAVIHFQPCHRDVPGNVDRLIQLTEEAGRNGAKIVVLPELATSGYSYFNRSQVRCVAETIPGRTTELFAEIARKYGIYIVVGLPEYEVLSNLFYNSAVLIGPNGDIVGVYRKNSHLMESSWSASGTGQVPVFHTDYGDIGILICADIYQSELSIQTTLKKAKFLILPTNGGVNIDLLRVRALEGKCHVVLSNRYGNEKNQYFSSVDSTNFNHFDEDHFTLIPPFFYDFHDGKSVVVDHNGKVQLALEEASDSIGYCDLSLESCSREDITRRPELYALLGHNTLDAYALKCMRRPDAGKALVAAADLKLENPKELFSKVRESLQFLVNDTSFFASNLRLVVFPSNVLSISSLEMEAHFRPLRDLAKEFNLDFVVGLQIVDGGRCLSRSYMFTSDDHCVCYNRLHKLSSETIELGEHFVVIDRDYGRIAVVQDKDVMIPETTKMLEKMGVDLVAVSADEEQDIMELFCRVRTSDYLHVVMSNKKGSKGVYAGGFMAFPSCKEDVTMALMELDMEHVRDKKELRMGPDPLFLFQKAE